MPAYNSALEKFAGFDAQVVGISGDSIFSHIAWQEKAIGILRYPLASDFHPHGNVAKTYGVFREGPPLPGISERARSKRSLTAVRRPAVQRPAWRST